MADTNMRIVIDSDTDGAVRGVKKVGGAIDDLDGSAVRSEKRLGKLGRTAAVGVGVGLGAATVAAFGFGKASVKAFQEAEAQMAVAEASLDRNNKGWRSHRGEIDKTIAAHTALSGFDDEDLYSSFANLSRITGDTTKAMGLQQTAMDVARAKHLSLEQATNLVGKAQLGNVTAIRKLGVELPKNATALQAIDALNRQFAGSAKAYGDTTAGQAEKMSVAWGNLQEDVGQAIIPLVNSMLSGLTKLIAWSQANWPVFRKYATDAFNAARDTAQRVMAWFNANVLPTIQRIVGGARAFWSKFGDDVKTAFGLVQRQVERAMVVIRAVVETAMAVLRGDWGKAWKGVQTIASTAMAGILDTLRTTAGLVVSIAVKIGAGIVRGIISGLRGLPQVGARLVAGVVAAIGSALLLAFNMAAGIGSAIVNGVLSGLSNLASSIKNKIQSAIGSALSGIDIPGFSPLDHAAKEAIAEPIISGATKGLNALGPKMAITLSKAVREAITAAKDKAAGLAGDLGSTIGQAIDAKAAQDIAVLDQSPEAVKLRTIQANQARAQAARERASLDQALADAQTPEQRMAAQRDLDDWLIEQERQTLENTLAQKRQAITDEATARTTATQRNLNDLQAALNQGLISQKSFDVAFKGILQASGTDYLQIGSLLGYNFALGFQTQVAGILGLAGKITAPRPTVLAGRGPDRPPPKIKLPSHATGIDYVPRTGPALIHSGEAVLNRQDAAAYRAGGMGSSVSIHFANGMEWLGQFVQVQVNQMAEGARRRGLAAGAVR